MVWAMQLGLWTIHLSRLLPLVLYPMCQHTHAPQGGPFLHLRSALPSVWRVAPWFFGVVARVRLCRRCNVHRCVAALLCLIVGASAHALRACQRISRTHSICLCCTGRAVLAWLPWVILGWGGAACRLPFMLQSAEDVTFVVLLVAFSDVCAGSELSGTAIVGAVLTL